MKFFSNFAGRSEIDIFNRLALSAILSSISVILRKYFTQFELKILLNSQYKISYITTIDLILPTLGE